MLLCSPTTLGILTNIELIEGIFVAGLEEEEVYQKNMVFILQERELLSEHSYTTEKVGTNELIVIIQIYNF